MKARQYPIASFLASSHPWECTEHCLRASDSTCTNDHTGCAYNDGHNTCGHPSRVPRIGHYDSPLRKVERKCVRCKQVGTGFRKLGPEHICPDCWFTCRAKFA